MSASTESSGTYRIEPLKGSENYLTWRVQITDILTDMGLWEHTSGDKAQPTDAAEFAVWNKKDRKALTTIRLRVSNTMMSHVLTAETSKEAFDSLSNVFNTEGAIARVTLRRKLFRYTIEEGSDINDEIRKIKTLFQELTMMKSVAPSIPTAAATAVIGQLNDNELAMIILTALPPSWNPFISSISTDALLKSSDLIGRILSGVFSDFIVDLCSMHDGRRRHEQVPGSTS